jgi:carbamoyl-phosphate synthase small subunit
LKFGHHGGNHPIMNHQTGKVEITAQNHNYNVDPDSLPADVERTHTNLNDQTLAGLKHKTDPMFSVQYHPEASPGPHDSHYLFKDFRKMMEEWKDVTPRWRYAISSICRIFPIFSAYPCFEIIETNRSTEF